MKTPEVFVTWQGREIGAAVRRDGISLDDEHVSLELFFSADVWEMFEPGMFDVLVIKWAAIEDGIVTRMRVTRRRLRDQANGHPIFTVEADAGNLPGQAAT